VIILFMALPFFVESAPRAYRLKAGNADPLISTSSGTSPQGISLSGDIKSCNRLVVEGSLDGTLHDGGQMQIAEGGYFRGVYSDIPIRS
jgi:hypothetical protein